MKRVNRYSVMGIICLSLVFSFSLETSAATFVTGLTSPTGIAIHPQQRALYVKSGAGGTVWKVPILPNGSAGTASVVTDQFDPPQDIKFDAQGNLYGLTFDQNNGYICRLDSAGAVCKAFTYTSGQPIGPGIAIEAPRNSSKRLFFGYGGSRLCNLILSAFSCGSSFFYGYYNSCGPFNFLLYRTTRADLAASIGSAVKSVNINDGSCSTLIGNLVQAAGLAEDKAGNLYVADSGAGTITKRTPLGTTEVIATGLNSPTGLVYDVPTGLLFISEANANRVTTLPVNPPPTPPPPSFVSNLPNPTGLAIHPLKRSLYVKSGAGGTVWEVYILPNGSAGTVSVVTDQFDPPQDIKFDAQGNLYGLTSDQNNGYICRLDSASAVCKAFTYTSGQPIGPGIAIEAPGNSSKRLFFGYGGNRLCNLVLSAFSCGSSFFYGYYNSCGPFNFLLYRTTRADLAASIGNAVKSVNINDGSCSTLIGSLVQAAGLAEDKAGNLYVADTGAGTITRRTPIGTTEVIATGFTSPTGLVYDEVTGLLFIAETDANRVSTWPRKTMSKTPAPFLELLLLD